MSKAEWVVATTDGRLKCNRCGRNFKLLDNSGCSIAEFVKMSDAFISIHKECKVKQC